MAHYDISTKLLPFMDRHMHFVILDFVLEKQLYKFEQVQAAKVNAAAKTYMVEFWASEYGKLHNGDEPATLEQRTQEVTANIAAVEHGLGPILPLVQDEYSESGELISPCPADALVQSGAWTYDSLASSHQVTATNITCLYDYAKVTFEYGQYKLAAKCLGLYRRLMSDRDAERSFWALWGKLAAEIISGNWDQALYDLRSLSNSLESRSAPALEVLQQRTWLAHWSLFIFFNIPNGRELMVEFFAEPRMLNAIHMNCPHLFRYFAAALIVNKRRMAALNSLVPYLRSVDPSPSSALTSSTLKYRDPLISFLLAVHVDFDAAAAAQHVRDMSPLVQNDFFLAYYHNEMLEQARLMLFYSASRISSTLDIAKLKTMIDLEHEVLLDKDNELVIATDEQRALEDEKRRAAVERAQGESAAKVKELESDVNESVLVTMIRACQLDAKISSLAGQVIMQNERPPVYQQIIDKSRSAMFRSVKLKNELEARYAVLAQQ